MKIRLMMDGVLRSVSLEQGEREGSFVGELDGEPVEFDAVLAMPGVVSLIVTGGSQFRRYEGRMLRCVFDRAETLENGSEGTTISIGPAAFQYQMHDPRSLTTRRKRAHADEGTLLLKATMAGRVVRILAERGSEVAAHEGILVIEAMKMQNELRSPRAGRVTELRVAADEMVSAGQVLAVIE